MKIDSVYNWVLDKVSRVHGIEKKDWAQTFDVREKEKTYLLG